MHGHLLPHLNVASAGGYNTYQTIMLILGMVIWAALYAMIAYRGLKTHFVQMPLVMACGNIVWEFLWGFIFQTDGHQTGVLIGMGSAFLIDLTIFYSIWRYGPKYLKEDLNLPFLAHNVRWVSILGIAIWAIILVTFQIQGLDNPGGGTSGNVLNTLIAFFWMSQLMHIKDIKKLSVTIGWLKLLADIPVALFLMSVFPDKYFTWSITWISVFVDILFIGVYYGRLKGWIKIDHYFTYVTPPVSKS